MTRFFRLFFLCVTIALVSSCGGGGSAAGGASHVPEAKLLAAQTFVEPQTGWYWNPSEGGRGFAIERQGNQLFMAAFLYEVTGEATWYVSTLTAQSDGHYAGDLTRYSGGQTLLGTYKSATPAKIANVSLSFSTATVGVMNVDSLTGSQAAISIQRYPFSTPTAFAASQGVFDSGWWWNAAEGGRGYFIEMQGSQAFIGSFMYDNSGQPTWYTSSANLQGPINVSGALEQYSGGQSLYGTFKPAPKTSTNPGTMSFHLTSGNTGTLTLPNGTAVPLSRFVFNPVAPVGASSNLMISEVSTVFYSDDVAWVEVYNPNSVAVPLSDYSLRTGSISGTSWTTAPTIFTLPRVDVPAKGYMIIGGKVDVPISDNNQMVMVNNGTKLPYWQANGAIELVKGGQTADFVRFGTATTAPLTAAAWSGANVAALPSGANEHGKSIVRLASGGMVDSNTASDWTQTKFATPAGPNDVAGGVTDSDGDGVPDSAKIQGNTYAGMDLYAMGARPGKRDIFIQIDHMKTSDPATTPRKEALQKLVDTFAAKNLSPQKNIAMHLDAGNLYSSSFNAALFNLGGGKEVVASTCIQLPYSDLDAGCNSLFDYKSAGFDIRRKLLFHYVLMGTTQNPGGDCDSGGIGDVGGNNILVSMGSCGYSTNAGIGLTVLINSQAATIMHELGHNLGLLHGGNEDNNFKPNYYSIMNYLYSYTGLSASPSGIHAADRYYGETSTTAKYATYKNPCNLDNSPCTTSFIMDYSDGSSIDLNENALDESKNIGRGAVSGAYADWDNNSSMTTGPVLKDIHQSDTTTSLGILKDYNDWANLVLPMTRGYSYGIGSDTSPLRKRVGPRKNTINDRSVHLIREDPMPKNYREVLRQTRLQSASGQ